MSDNLRDRIAAAIVGVGCPCTACTAAALEKADAVIEVLNLRTDQVGTLTRHVTEWIDNG